MLYTAPARTLAVLETTAHVSSSGFPLNRYLVTIEVPDTAWAKRTIATPDTLPPAWDAIPHARPSIAYGSAWYRAATSALLDVPSAILPEESVIIINCAHPDVAGKMTATLGRKFHYDSVLHP